MCMSPPMSEKILDFLKSLTTTEKRDIGFYIDTEQRDKIHRDDVLRELSEAPNLCTITEAIRILDNEALAEARDLALVREFEIGEMFRESADNLSESQRLCVNQLISKMKQ